MGALSLWHWLIIVLVIVILFGRGRISSFLGELGQGVRSLRHGISSIDEDVRPSPGSDTPTGKGG
jgi:sec-independent protein translocase protein TatA